MFMAAKDYFAYFFIGPYIAIFRNIRSDLGLVSGMQVSGNHISSAHEGDTVRAVGTVVHKGRSSHVWNVDVFTSTNKLVSSIRVVNSVMKKR